MEALVSLIVLLLCLCAIEVVVLLCGGIAALCGMKFRLFVKRASWLLLLPLLLFAYGSLVERNILRVRETVLESPAVPESFDGFRIVQISDLHLKSFESRKGALQRAADRINSLDADIIVFSGDLVTMSADEIVPFTTILSQLKAKEGIYSVMGNHDYLPYSRELSQSQREDGIARLKEAEAAFGWQMLDNGNVNLYRTDGDCISVIGIENLSAKGNFQSYGDIDRASAGADGGFKILISHDPSAWEPFIAGKRDIDLTLSGHTHDMQVSFFGYTPSALIYEQHSGLYSSTYLSGDEEFPQYLYVNTGLGETVFPARIGVPPEISLLVLRRK